MQYELKPPVRLSPASIAALAVAAASFIVSCSGYGLQGLILSFVGMGAGLVAFILAHRSGVRDAAACLVAIAVSVFDLVPAIAVMVSHFARHP